MASSARSRENASIDSSRGAATGNTHSYGARRCLCGQSHSRLTRMHKNPESAPCETLIKRMHPDLAVQHAGGGASGGACSCKASALCMKRLTASDLVGAAKSASPPGLIPCDRYAQGCIKQSLGRLHGSLDVDDGKDVCARTWGFGAGVAADAAVGSAPGESGACRGVCDGAMAPGAGYRGIGHPFTCRYSKALALGSRAKRFGLRMRWLAGTGASWAFWCLLEMSGLWPRCK